MTKLKNVLWGLFFLATPTIALAHGNDVGPVALELSSPNPVQAEKSVLTFQLVDTDKNVLISESDLNISHEKKLHMLIYDPSLNEFQHVHPEFTFSSDKTWKVDVSFAVNGNYWVWVQGELSSYGTEFSAPTRLKVVGGSPELAAPQLSDVRMGENSNSILTLSKTDLKAGKMAMLDMSFSRKDGSTPELSPYLGAIAHIVATSVDGDSLVHVHPMAGSNSSTAMLHVTFQEAGFYRLWIQFIDGGILKVIPLSVEVTK